MTAPAVPVAWVALSLVEHLGGRKLAALLGAFGGDPATVLAANDRDLQRVPGIGPKLSAAIRAVNIERTAKEIARWREAGVQILASVNPDYPPRLRALGEDAPPCLFVRGALDALIRRCSVAIVGTRQPSAPAREAAVRLGMDLARAGCVVISGLAAGIDAAAHNGTLSGRGCAVAVLGSGVRQIFPPDHAALADLILRTGGALVSEVNPDARASTPRLVARNRLISGLSDAVIVAESSADGGAMYAARGALAQGRRLFALDLPATGNQALITDGAVALAMDAPATMILTGQPPL
jgi:DNA processing protein